MFIKTATIEEKLVLSKARYLVNIPVIDKFKDLVFFPGPELSMEVIKTIIKSLHISIYEFCSMSVNSQSVAPMNL